jgi:predicted PurR-regulated permease PerM
MSMQRWRWIAGLGGLAVLGWTVWWLSAVFVPLAIGLLLAFVLAPTVDKLEPKLGSRAKAAGLLLSGSGLVLALGTVASIPLLAKEVQHWIAAVSGEGNQEIAKDLTGFVDYGGYVDPDLDKWDSATLVATAIRMQAPARVIEVLRHAIPAQSTGDTDLAAALGDRDGDGRLDPGYVKRIQMLAKNRNSALGQRLASVERTKWFRDGMTSLQQATSREQIKKLLTGGQTWSTAGDVGKRLLGGVLTWLSLATAVALGTLLVPVYAFFLLMALPRWRDRVPLYFPASSRETSIRILRRIRDSISAFVRGRLVVCAIVGLVTAVGWAVLGVRLGALAGMAVGALTLIPLANLLVLAPVTLMSLLDVASDVHGWAWFAGMLGAFTLGQIAESVLNPLIVGDAVQLDTLSMLVALFAGGAVGGFLGLLLAVPVAATARILAEELVLPRWRAWADEA